MLRRATYFTFFTLFSICAFGQSSTNMRYDLDVEVVDTAQTITGALVVTWENMTSSPTSELYWHVYNNAWSKPSTVFLQEGIYHGSQKLPRTWGGTEVSEIFLVSVNNQETIEQELEFEYVDPLDKTVARTELAGLVIMPGETVTVSLKFVSKMPQAFRRSGWGEGGYLHAVQWFPKLGVFEDIDGEVQWNCEPYHYLSEFYSDFATYDVTLTLPKHYEGQIVTTGTLSDPEFKVDKVIYNSTTEGENPVHDFAFTVDPNALVYKRTFNAQNFEFRDKGEELKVALSLGLPAEQNKLLPENEVEMILMLQPEHSEYKERYFNATAKALYYFGLWYGDYPYKTISIVDPANNARNTGGMEYPRLFTGGVRLGMAERTLRPQGVTVHEFGHQYWYGIVASDEFRHAWIDEGFTTFDTNRILDAAWEPALATYDLLGKQYYGQAPLSLVEYGEGDIRSNFSLQRLEVPENKFSPKISFSLRDKTSLSSFLQELPVFTYYPRVEKSATLGLRSSYKYDWGQPLCHFTYDLFHNDLRRVNAYRRPALMLQMIKRSVGDEVFIRLMRDYYESFRFKHPRPQDFFKVVSEHASGSSINWPRFWRHAYEENHELDYAAHHLKNNSREGGRYFVEFGVRRLGTFVMPVEIEISFEDGTTVIHEWNGEESAYQVDLGLFNSPAVRLDVDPQRKLMLDRNWLNNSLISKESSGANHAWHIGLRTMYWAQQILHYFGGAG